MYMSTRRGDVAKHGLRQCAVNFLGSIESRYGVAVPVVDRVKPTSPVSGVERIAREVARVHPKQLAPGSPRRENRCQIPWGRVRLSP